MASCLWLFLAKHARHMMWIEQGKVTWLAAAYLIHEARGSRRLFWLWKFMVETERFFILFYFIYFFDFRPLFSVEPVGSKFAVRFVSHTSWTGASSLLSENNVGSTPDRKHYYWLVEKLKQNTCFTISANSDLVPRSSQPGYHEINGWRVSK